MWNHSARVIGEKQLREASCLWEGMPLQSSHWSSPGDPGGVAGSAAGSLSAGGWGEEGFGKACGKDEKQACVGSSSLVTDNETGGYI